MTGFKLSLILLLSSGIAAGFHYVAGPKSLAGGVTEGPKINWGALLPEGDGRSEVEVSCSGCHDLRQVLTQKKTKANWDATVRKMVSAYQAPVDPADIPSVVEYLAKNFNDNNPIDQLPMNVNTCSEAALERLPGINKDLAEAIVASRKSDGAFPGTDALLRVKGLDGKEVEKIKDFIKFSE